VVTVLQFSDASDTSPAVALWNFDQKVSVHISYLTKNSVQTT